MSSQDISDLVNEIDKLLVNWYIISSPIDDIEKGVLNTKRRIMIYAANFIACIETVIALIAFAAPKESLLHFYVLNGVHSLGFLGRIFSGIIMVGYPMDMMHSIVILMNEKRGTLTPVTNIKHMFDKLNNPSPRETKRLMFSLKALRYFPLMHLGGTISMECIKAVGAVMTALSFKSWAWALAYIPRGIASFVGVAHASQNWAVSHLLITNSATYLTLRLDRVIEVLSTIVSMPGDRIQANKRNISWLINRNLKDLDCILNEVNDHNRCIKYWLRDELVCIGIVISFIIVFFIEGANYYEKGIIGMTITAVLIVLIISFAHAAYLYVQIRSTANLLKSLQLKTQFLMPVPRPRTISVIQRPNPEPQFADVIQTKHQILLLIHRTSSPYLRIGFTEGNTESFSPESVASVISIILTTPLMFLNAKHSF